jgi:TonB family protein
MKSHKLALLTLAFVSTASADEVPRVIHQEAVAIPTHACEGLGGNECRVTLEFSVQPSGSVSNIVIAGSSGFRACDQTARSLVAKRSYAPIKEAVKVKEIVTSYACPVKKEKELNFRQVPTAN